MITFMESKETWDDGEKCLDSQLWHACAGSMVQLPAVNSKVFYFPQGHGEHASGNVDFRACPKVPSYIPCRVSVIKFLADSETDEVYAKMRLFPLGVDELGFEDGGGGVGDQEKPASFAKTLTQSDANNGGGFSVPRYCAETIFPRLDYSADPPVQTILAKDVHGETWKFRHIYRGTPRRHLLTTGWSTFVNHKKLVAGDSIVFMRAENGDLCVGIRRAKRGIGGGPEMATGWNPGVGNSVNSVVSYGGFSAIMREDGDRLSRHSEGCTGGGAGVSRGKVKADDVSKAVTLAAHGQPFDVIYYPRASTPEFCVRATLVKTALQIRWCPGMRFKMAFETEDSSRISWFMGTISTAQVADPILWPDSPWRLLQVTWDEPDLLQNVKRVNPWLVELVSNVPAIHFSPFAAPPHKKLRVPPHSEFPLDAQIPLPAFSGNPFGCLPNNTPAGMQGARHPQYGLSLPDIHRNALQLGLLPAGFRPPNQASTSFGISSSSVLPKLASKHDNVSCLLTIGNPSQGSKNLENGKAAPFLLFGQPILPENQTSWNRCNDTCASNGNCNASDESVSALNQTKPPNPSSGEGFQSKLSLDAGLCKVFIEFEDVGRTLDLALLNSYDELYRKVANMFSIEVSDMQNRVLYRDAADKVRPLGDEPFSNFAKTARRLTILTNLEQR